MTGQVLRVVGNNLCVYKPWTMGEQFLSTDPIDAACAKTMRMLAVYVVLLAATGYLLVESPKGYIPAQDLLRQVPASTGADTSSDPRWGWNRHDHASCQHARCCGRGHLRRCRV